MNYKVSFVIGLLVLGLAFVQINQSQSENLLKETFLSENNNLDEFKNILEDYPKNKTIFIWETCRSLKCKNMRC
jgi:hypothetical protein